MQKKSELTSDERGTLEKLIDTHIQSIPLWISMLRNPTMKQYLQFKDETDVVYGMILGAIFEKFNMYYIMINLGKDMPDEKRFEVNAVVFKRAKEIKDAIFKCG